MAKENSKEFDEVIKLIQRVIRNFESKKELLSTIIKNPNWPVESLKNLREILKKRKDLIVSIECSFQTATKTKVNLLNEVDRNIMKIRALKLKKDQTIGDKELIRRLMDINKKLEDRIYEIEQTPLRKNKGLENKIAEIRKECFDEIVKEMRKVGIMAHERELLIRETKSPHAEELSSIVSELEALQNKKEKLLQESNLIDRNLSHLYTLRMDLDAYRIVEMQDRINERLKRDADECSKKILAYLQREKEIEKEIVEITKNIEKLVSRKNNIEDEIIGGAKKSN